MGFDLKFWHFSRHFGIAAPRVVVRSRFPISCFGLLLLCVGGVFFALAGLVFIRPFPDESGYECQLLTHKLAEATQELHALRSTAATGQNVLSIERAAQQKLWDRVQVLEAENAALKEEELLVERLLTAKGKEGVRVEGFRISEQGQGVFNYRVLLAFQADRNVQEFRGNLQLLIRYRDNGVEHELVMPDKKSDLPQFVIEVKHVSRHSGVFELPLGASLVSVEARILKGDLLKSKYRVQL